MKKLVIAAVALVVPFALSMTEASAAQPSWKTLSKSALKSTLLPKSDTPPWFPSVQKYQSGTAQKITPWICSTKDSEIVGTTAPLNAFAEFTYKTSNKNNLFDVGVDIYQYKGYNSALAAWQDIEAKIKECAGSHTTKYRDADGNVTGTTTVTITVEKGNDVGSSNEWIVREDIQVTSKLPKGTVKKWASDEISHWVWAGHSVIEVEADKFVKGTTGWTFNQTEESTVDALFHVQVDRYNNKAA